MIDQLTRRAFADLHKSAKSFLEGQAEWMIWRHLLRSKRKENSKNAFGHVPGQTPFHTTDYLVRGQRQGLDRDGRNLIYCQGRPEPGDLLITLAGAPATKEAAQSARELEYYKAVDYDNRSVSGDTVYTLVKAVPDRSGRYR